MRFNKVLLVNPYYLGRGGLRPPVNIGTIAEILNAAGIDYDVLDMTMGHSKYALAAKIKNYQPGLIAVSMMTYTYLKIFGLISYIKERFPHIPIIGGGPHISAFKEEALRQCSSLDYGWVYECENGLADFCRGKDSATINGLIYRQGKEIKYALEGQFSDNLDALPFPKYEKFDLRGYLKEIDLVTSRGCPYLCVFCPASNGSGKKLRFRSAACVLQEIGYWYNKGYRNFAVADDNFTIDKDRAIKILDLIRRAGFRDIIFRASTGIRADLLDKELLEKMKLAGFKHISIAVENASNRVLALMKKHESIERIEETVKLACEMGIDVTLFFVVGSIGETYADFLKSVEFSRKYPILNAMFNNMTPYPKTEMYNWVKANAVFTADYPQYLNRNKRSYDYFKPVFYTSDFSYQERCRALKLRDKISRQILRNALRRKLSRLGAIGGLAAFFAAFFPVYELIINTKLLRKFAEKFLFSRQFEPKERCAS